MAFGKKTRETAYNKSPVETLADLEKALIRVGKVKSIDQSALSINGRIRFGLQSIKIEAAVAGNENESTISFIAKSDDVGGVGAQKGLERLIETLENVDDLSYEVSRTGLNKLQWGYLALVLLGIPFFFIMASANVNWLADNKASVSALGAVFVWLGFRVFKRS